MIYLPYARVSPRGSEWREKDIESSIPAQLHTISQWVDAHDPDGTVLSPVEDEFRSAKEDSLDARPGMRTILADLDSGGGEWDVLITIDMDRVTRAMADATALLKRLTAAQRGLVAIRQAWDYSTPMGRLMLLQTVAFSEYFLATISAKTRDKMLHIARQGEWPAGTCPMGYMRAAKHDNVLRIDPRKAETVRTVFALYAGGSSSIEISRETGIPVKTILNRVLRNPIYIGRIRYGDYEGPGKHEPIIDEALYRRVQELLPGAVPGPRPNRRRYDYLLGGLVHCHCGHSCRPYSATNRHGKKYAYYRCGNTDHRPRRSIPAAALEDAVIAGILALPVRPEVIAASIEMLRSHRAAARSDAEPDLSRVRSALVQAERDRSAIDHAFLAGIVTPDNSQYWNARLSAIRAEIARLETRRTDLAAIMADAADPLLDADLMLSEISRLTDALRDDPHNADLRRAAIAAHIERIDHRDDGRFAVTTVWSASPGGCVNLPSLASRRGTGRTLLRVVDDLVA